jgi:hypothetical protein
MANVAILKPGDILLFTSDGSHVDKIICLLTQSEVAHSALFYGKDSQGEDVLVDAATGCGIAGHRVRVLPPQQIASSRKTPSPQPKFDERKIYVRRLSAPPPFDPVLQAAKAYVLENNGFNRMGLISVGLHLLFRMDPLPGRIAKLFIELLGMLTHELKVLFPSNAGGGAHGPHPMYCSQFVYQCFDDGGRPLPIGKRAPGLTPSTTLVDRIERASTPLNVLLAPPPSTRGLQARTFEEVVAELDDELSQPGPSAPAVSPYPSPDLIRATLDFGLALQQVQEPHRPMDFAAGLSILKTLQAQFVTPADLLSHCSSGTVIGDCSISLELAPAQLP